MYFINRKDAASQLIPLLEKYKNEDVVVLAVPRGGVPIAYYIAKKYNFPLDLLMTKKIGHPFNPEFAIGAVSNEGHLVDETQNVPAGYIEEKVSSIRKNLMEKYEQLMGSKQPLNLKNKTVIIVDDGIATGYTILSSIKMLRKQEPKKIIIAVPVAPPETSKTIKKEVDDFICPYMPQPFFGVGQHYGDFSQVTDEEVIAFLKELNQK
jgi:putative phosphoribosyl transferase